MGIPKSAIEQLLRESEDHSCKEAPEICVKVMAIANLPTQYGDYQAVAFWNNFDKKDVPVRLHSECLTGDAIGSLRCDCREQLQESLNRIGKMENGIVLYLRQEGRGIGFVNKIRAYQLQDAGFDTVEANKKLGFRPDERDYDIAAHMLMSLHVRSVKLLTNNPDKLKDLQLHGIRVAERIPVVMPPNQFNKFYLETKRKKLGHILEIEQRDDLGHPHSQD